MSPASESRDNEIKRQLYAKYGVPNYWVFDPSNRLAAALPIEDGAYREAAIAHGDEVFSAPPFFGFTIPLAEIWE